MSWNKDDYQNKKKWKETPIMSRISGFKQTPYDDFWSFLG